MLLYQNLTNLNDSTIDSERDRERDRERERQRERDREREKVQDTSIPLLSCMDHDECLNVQLLSSYIVH